MRNGKTADELALGNLQNQGDKGKGFQGNCHNYRKTGHKSANCKASKKEKGNKNESITQGGKTRHTVITAVVMSILR